MVSPVIIICRILFLVKLLEGGNTYVQKQNMKHIHNHTPRKFVGCDFFLHFGEAFQPHQCFCHLVMYYAQSALMSIYLEGV